MVKALIEFMVCLYSTDELREVDALIAETISLYQTEQATGDSEFSRLLSGLVKQKQLPHGIIDAIAYYVSSIGLGRTLDLIQESPAAEMLLPMATALQLELGQDPLVAKEVKEVAEDTRRKMVELKGRALSGLLTASGILTVGRPENS